MNEQKPKADSNLFVSPDEFFKNLVREGFSSRKMQTYPQVESYLVALLQHYLDARNLFDPEHDESGRRIPSTLAEMYLVANTTEDPQEKIQLLKKLGDRSLYVSGFFGDSLSRKAVDIDYYVNMGGAAYATLASCVRQDTTSKIYSTMANRFIDYVDLLTYISNNSFVQTNESILRLYDRYMTTGSELAREKLSEMGIRPSTQDQSKVGRQ
ncbi:MAG: hypothetical protein EOP06_08205 [Proteobacteria bacterium]|nr:MAG: hypothetical protein EOP06_08205 [Pseudomonadota bacterium]